MRRLGHDRTRVRQDPAAQQTAALTSDLEVSYTPYIVITDANGYTVARYRG